MKNKLISVFSASLLAANLVSCAPHSAPEIISGEKQEFTKPSRIVTDSYSPLSKFSSEFSKTVATMADKSDNTLFSPLSAYLAMSMIGEGAGGVTLEEFNSVFGDVSESEIFDLISHLSTLNDTTLDIANSLWIDTKFEPKQAFVDTLSKYYSADVYKSVLKDSESEINSWIEAKTNGMIKDMLDENAFSDESVMALINAIYMNAKWRDEFNADMTKEREFTSADGQKSMVDFMRNGEEMEYIFETDDYIGVTLKYKDDSLSFMAVMPKDEKMDTDGLMELITTEGGGFAAIGESAELRLTRLFIPTFEQEYSTSLNDAFKKMGVISAFEDHADFSGIAGNIKINNVLQNAVLRLDEAGTEAAAVTIIEVYNTSAMLPTEEPLHLEFNRPFVFAVYDKDSGAVLFCGEHNKP